MNSKLPENVLSKYPRLKNTLEAIELYKKVGNQEIKCAECGGLIKINEDKSLGYLESNCACGKSKYRMKWGPDKT